MPEAAKLAGYHPYWCSTEGGRGGVAILSKNMPYHIEKNIGDEEMDEEGRIITADYSKYYVVSVYVPNAGRKLVNMERRMRWNQLFDRHINKLKEKKPVIICGDMNVAHEEIGKHHFFIQFLFCFKKMKEITVFLLFLRFGQSKNESEKCRIH